MQPDTTQLSLTVLALAAALVAALLLVWWVHKTNVKRYERNRARPSLEATTMVLARELGDYEGYVIALPHRHRSLTVRQALVDEPLVYLLTDQGMETLSASTPLGLYTPYGE